MLIVRVELHSARTGQITEIASMAVANIGGDERRGDYFVKVYRKGQSYFTRGATPIRTGQVENYPRKSLHVWHLIARALAETGYE